MNDTRFIEHARPLTKDKQLIFREWNPVASIPTGQKPGFGGSGSACVIATRLMDMSWKRALKIHHQVQGGGSGIDVKASILGGMFIWEPVEERTQSLAPYHPVVVWTGESAKLVPEYSNTFIMKIREWFVRNSIRFTTIFGEPNQRYTQTLYKNLSMMSREASIPISHPVLKS